jgi:hypothetical protein
MKQDWLQVVIGRSMTRKTFIRVLNVRILSESGFFLGELYGLSCCACDIGNAFLYGKTNEKVYVTAGPEFGITLCSLLRLGYMKTQHDHDL